MLLLTRVRHKLACLHVVGVMTIIAVLDILMTMAIHGLVHRIVLAEGLGEYKHPNYLHIIKKLKEAGRYNWKLRFASSCSTRNMSKDSQGYYLFGVEGNILKKINY